jgi:DNA-binding protein HU-beta
MPGLVFLVSFSHNLDKTYARRKRMKKEDLVRFVSDKADITQKAAGETVNAVLEGISSALGRGDFVSLIGFGSFKVVERAAREGRNPRTGEKINIPASKSVKFSPGKAIKQRVQ